MPYHPPTCAQPPPTVLHVPSSSSHRLNSSNARIGLVLSLKGVARKEAKRDVLRHCGLKASIVIFARRDILLVALW
jgi:hypothetical protein